jgi:hypothetical protein
MINHNNYNQTSQFHTSRLVFYKDDGNTAKTADAENADEGEKKPEKQKPKEPGKLLKFPEGKDGNLIRDKLNGKDGDFASDIEYGNRKEMYDLLKDKNTFTADKENSPDRVVLDMLREGKINVKDDKGDFALELLKITTDKSPANAARYEHAKTILRQRRNKGITTKEGVRLLKEFQTLSISEQANATTIEAQDQAVNFKGMLEGITGGIEEMESSSKNWTPEPIPEEFKSMLTEVHAEYESITSELKTLESQIADLERRKKDEKNAEKIKEIEAKIKAHLDKLKKIRAKLGELVENKFFDIEKRYTEITKRQLGQFRRVKEFERMTGIRLGSVNEVVFVLSDKGRVTFTIEELFFDDRLMVRYRDQDGNPVPPTSDVDFIRLVNEFKAHEDIKEAQELNEAVESNTAGFPIDIGQVFKRGVIKKENEVVNEEFSIISIKEAGPVSISRKGKDWNEPSVMSLGEFAAFVKKGGYHLELTSAQFKEAIEAREIKLPEENEKMKVWVGTERLPLQKATITRSANEVTGKLAFTIKSEEDLPAILLMLANIDHSVPRKEATVSGAELFEMLDREVVSMSAVPGSPAAAAEAAATGTSEATQSVTSRTGGGGGGGGGTSGGGDTPSDGGSGSGSGSGSDGGGDTPGGDVMPDMPGITERDIEVANEVLDTVASESGDDDGPKFDKAGNVIRQLQKGTEGGNKEVLPYAMIHKVGGMSREEASHIASIWAQTRMLSLDDIFQMIKTGYDYYIRRFERKQKEKFSHIAKDLPYFSSEMQRLNVAAEEEEVHQFTESMKDWGISQIEDRLRHSKNPDEVKACISTLVEKGELRWDDIDLWKNINRILAKEGHSHHSIPIPSNGDPATQMSETDKRTGMDFLMPALDAIWGEGTYNEWLSKNDSSFESKAKSYNEEGAKMENTPGGHEEKLAQLLKVHKHGGYVSPHEFEGLIRHAIENGKSTMQVKVYYMVAGVAAKNPEGRTILTFDRMSHINQALLPQFPLLEYIAGKIPRPDGKGEVISSPLTRDDYAHWLRMFDGDDPTNCYPNANVDDFMWEKIFPDDKTQDRINKVLRNGQNLDHDDAFAYLPPASEQVMQNTCTNVGGQRKALTYEGYANIFPGFSMYFRGLAKSGNTYKLAEAFKSYMRYESIMDKRFFKTDTNYARLDDSMMNNATIVSDQPPILFKGEIETMFDAVIDMYGDQDLIETYKLCKLDTGNVMGTENKKNKELQDKVQYALETFGKKFEKVVDSDGGRRMVSVVQSSQLTGMPYKGSMERDQEKMSRGPSREDAA